MLENFKIAPCLRDQRTFTWQSVEILNVFNNLTLKQIFWKKKTFFKKLEHRFLVESTNTENASLPYITAISEVNVKTNRMVSTKWTCHHSPNTRLDEDVFRLRLQRKSSRRLAQDQNIRLGHTSSRCLEDALKTYLRRLAKRSSRRFQDVFLFKTSCKNVFKTSSRRSKDVFKTFLRHL